MNKKGITEIHVWICILIIVASIGFVNWLILERGLYPKDIAANMQWSGNEKDLTDCSYYFYDRDDLIVYAKADCDNFIKNCEREEDCQIILPKTATSWQCGGSLGSFCDKNKWRPNFEASCKCIKDRNAFYLSDYGVIA